MAIQVAIPVAVTPAQKANTAASIATILGGTIVDLLLRKVGAMAMINGTEATPVDTEAALVATKTVDIHATPDTEAGSVDSYEDQYRSRHHNNSHHRDPEPSFSDPYSNPRINPYSNPASTPTPTPATLNLETSPSSPTHALHPQV